ncbi:MAG: CBS domain-containing protein [Desulfobacterales bacterium]|nr:CBS domain-containing protein [Desulfobacterales bacterium]
MMNVTYAVENIMSEDIVSVDGSAPLGDAMKLMLKKDIGSVIVSRDGEKVGILTERDVLRQCCLFPDCIDKSVGDVMSAPLIVIEGDAPIGKAADLMAEKKIRRLPVVVDGKVRGVITERDLMRATLDVFNKLSDAWF